MITTPKWLFKSNKYNIIALNHDPNMEVYMTEKYKIYLPEDMRTRLMNDAELFEFIKKDGSVNLNAFLKVLLVDYFDPYRETKARLLDTILSDLSEYSSISDEDANAIADKIINTYLRGGSGRSDRSAAITLTVSGASLDVMRAIENNLLGNISLSQYVYDMFQSYLSISRSNREMIIFRDTFSDLQDAIRKKNVITFSSTTVPELVFTVEPYMIAASKEEQFNYLLCRDKKTGFPRTFRVSRIQALYITPEKYEPNEKIIRELQEAAARSPQSVSRSVEAKVRLTDRGIKMFRAITKNRPDVLKKEDHIYFFNWPKKQLEEYFQRFGRDAVILSPEECRESVRIFYGKALDAYAKPV